MSAMSRPRSSGVMSVAPGIDASDHSKKRGQSSPTPNSSLMIMSGKGTDTAGTKSTGAPGSSAATSASARARTAGSRARMTDGANPGCTSLR